MPTPKKISPDLVKAKTLRLADATRTCAEIAAMLQYHERQVIGHLSILRKTHGINWEIDKETKKITVIYKRGEGFDDIVETAPATNGAANPSDDATASSVSELVSKINIMRSGGASWKSVAEELSIPVARARRLVAGAEAA